VGELVVHDREGLADGVDVRRILLASEHRQVELRDDGVAELVSQHEQQVADHERDPLLPLLRGEAAHARVVRHPARQLHEARLERGAARLQVRRGLLCAG
jgi:hypothetical protein